MKKIVVSVTLFVFAYFISAYAYSGVEILANFDLSKSMPSASQFSSEFSLKTNYQDEATGINVPFCDFNRYMAQAYSERPTDAESIKQEIQKLKKKRRGSIFGAAGLGILGGGLFYLFLTYKPSGESQEREREEASLSGGKIFPLGGALICWAVTIALISDASKKGKAIKAYQEELKKFGEEQRKAGRY